jgi:hypothetical protein
MADELWGGNVGGSLWNPPESFSIGYPRSGDLLTNMHPTHVGTWWFQAITEEIRTVIIAAGLVFDPTDTTQFLVALQELLHPTFELREDDGFELREDGSFELRQ